MSTTSLAKCRPRPGQTLQEMVRWHWPTMVTGARPASKRLGDRTRANRARAATVDLVIVALRDACGRAPWPAPLEATSLAASLLDADARFACIAIDSLERCR